ncbi:MAG: YceI family protein [Pseudomonadota bacterium]
MDINILLRRILIVVMAAGWFSLAHANVGEVELCEPFKDGKVDTSLINSMLDAARDGYLYRIEGETSKVGFCVSSKFSEVKGDFREVRGGLALMPASTVSGAEQAMLVINTASLDTQGSVVESLIKGERFFDVKKYPEILFVSRGFEWTGRDTATIVGDLTVHGVTRPVVFAVTLTPVMGSENGTVERMQVKATTTIQRSEFDMDSLSKLVSDSVDLCMSVVVVRYTT